MTPLSLQGCEGKCFASVVSAVSLIDTGDTACSPLVKLFYYTFCELPVHTLCTSFFLILVSAFWRHQKWLYGAHIQKTAKKFWPGILL